MADIKISYEGTGSLPISTSQTTQQSNLGFKSGRTTGNVTTTGQALTNVTGLSFTVNAGEVWCFYFSLGTGSTGTAGMQLGIQFGGGTLFARMNATTSGVTASTTAHITTSNATTVAINTANAQTGVASIDGLINNTTGGAVTVQLRFLKVTSGTATILANSFFTP